MKRRSFLKGLAALFSITLPGIEIDFTEEIELGEEPEIDEGYEDEELDDHPYSLEGGIPKRVDTSRFQGVLCDYCETLNQRGILACQACGSSLYGDKPDWLL